MQGLHRFRSGRLRELSHAPLYFPSTAKREVASTNQAEDEGVIHDKITVILHTSDRDTGCRSKTVELMTTFIHLSCRLRLLKAFLIIANERNYNETLGLSEIGWPCSQRPTLVH